MQGKTTCDNLPVMGHASSVCSEYGNKAGFGYSHFPPRGDKSLERSALMIAKQPLGLFEAQMPPGCGSNGWPITDALLFSEAGTKLDLGLPLVDQHASAGQ